MGHRALIAYERENGRYDVRYSHWGANGLKLKHLISEDDPLGEGYVEDEISFEDVTLTDVASNHLDYLHHEAFFVVDTAYNVTAYRTLWFGYTVVSNVDDLGDLNETIGNGMLTTIRWYEGEPVGDAIVSWFGGVRNTVEKMLSRDYLTTDEVRSFLFDMVNEKVHMYQDCTVPHFSPIKRPPAIR